MSRLAFVFVAIAALAMVGCSAAPEGIPAPDQLAFQPVPAGETWTGRRGVLQRQPVYPLTTCVVDGRPLQPTSPTFQAGGHTFRTCGAECRSKIEDDPFRFSKQVDAAVIAAQLPSYPLTVCPISGAPLGSKGEPVDLVLDGTLVRFCCRHCTRQRADERELVELVRNTAHNAQQLDYPLTCCVVSGRPLGERSVTAMFGTTMVQFCCPTCAAKFEDDPARYLPKLDTARSADWRDLDTASLPSGSAVQAQRRDYPLDTCPLCSGKLGTRGEPVDVELDGTLVRLCSANCADRAASRSRHLVHAVRAAAFAQQQRTYPLATCLVSGEPLGREAISVMVGTTLVRLGSERQLAGLTANPAKFLAALQAARAAAATATRGPCCGTSGRCCCDPPASAPDRRAAAFSAGPPSNGTR